MCLSIQLCSALLILLIMQPMGLSVENVQKAAIKHFRGPKHSLFGYAVTFHTENNVTRYLIGAPKSGTAQIRFGIQEPGAVYACDHGSSKCTQIPFDRTGNNRDNGISVDEKSGQWLGAALASAGSKGVIACAPRYIFYSINRKRKEPVGTCFQASNSFRDLSEFSPCRTRLWGYHEEGFCQAGFSATASQEFIFIGAVGMRYWQGQIFSKNQNATLVEHWTTWNETNDNQYLGYSMVTGHFFSSKAANESADLAVSAPKADQLRGNVHILSTNDPGRILYSFTGEQVGAYFGHSLAVGDFNGDGDEDLIVGAPLFSDPRGGFETGRAYIIYKDGVGFFKLWTILDGLSSRGRFGFASANIGDLNNDGVQDFCISAPFASYSSSNDAVGTGKIFIYHGIRDWSKSPEVVKVVSPQPLSLPVRSFGFSLASIVDQDDHVEILIGAPLSDLAFVATLIK